MKLPEVTRTDSFKLSWEEMMEVLMKYAEQEMGFDYERTTVEYDQVTESFFVDDTRER